MTAQPILATHAPELPALQRPRPAVVDEFERWSGTYFTALFAGRLFDQVLLPEVAAGVDWTGRIRFTPFGRAGRSAASDQLVLWGDTAVRDAEFERLKQLHRDVRGTSPEGVRFSALAPESWNWILISTMLMYIKSFEAVQGTALSGTDLQALWAHGLEQFDGLQLSGTHRLPERYIDVLAYYDEMLRTKAQRTDIFAHVTSHLRRPPAPEGTPAALRWAARLVGRLAVRPVAILSVGITEPTVRGIAGHRWTPRHRLEFAVYTAVIRVATRLPRRLVATPLAYHRWKCDRLIARYQAVGLDSFAPEQGCPMGH